VQCEYFHVALPEQLVISEGISFCIHLAATRLMLRACCHPVVVVAKFVEQDVEELECADLMVTERAVVLVSRFV
jgi:hypothetical protein